MRNVAMAQRYEDLKLQRIDTAERLTFESNVEICAPSLPDLSAEWLETDGLGGFASGTVGGVRTRRYHSFLTVATDPPAGRSILVNGLEAFVETPHERFPLSSQQYAAEIVAPDGFRSIVAFNSDPWPTWVYQLPDGTRVQHELFVQHGSPVVVLSWKLLDSPIDGSVKLTVRPFVSGRDYHALHHENPQFCFGPVNNNGIVAWQPYQSLPGVAVRCNGYYRHDPQWYRHFHYEAERERGFDHNEDLASPGEFECDLLSGEAVLILAADSAKAESLSPPEWTIRQVRDQERARRGALGEQLERAADCYIVRRNEGRSIIAGYPWFADWGRDTFIAIRGLCVATGRLAEAEQILLAWSGTIFRGMVPNRFPDSSSPGGEPEFNSVDASLWFVIAIYEFLDAAGRAKVDLMEGNRRRLQETIVQIVAGYAAGTRYGIRMDEDGLLAAGEKGQQLTWMDARVDGREITPRIGKPVEIQALWINALWIAGQFSERWRGAFAFARESFVSRFWNEKMSCLYDVIDVDHHPGAVDGSLRPNQIFAVGGLPMPLIVGEKARQVVDIVQRELWTPLGLRSLSPREPGYCARYEGSPAMRDGAYHQGTVWPWLAGPFVEAWVRVRGLSRDAKRQARKTFLQPLLEHLNTAGLGHVSEIVDAEPPHTPRGCPFQAWSVGELLRLRHVVLADAD